MTNPRRTRWSAHVHLLGQMPDDVLAARMAVTRDAVKQARLLRGIGPFTGRSELTRCGGPGCEQLIAPKTGQHHYCSELCRQRAYRRPGTTEPGQPPLSIAQVSDRRSELLARARLLRGLLGEVDDELERLDAEQGIGVLQDKGFVQVAIAGVLRAVGERGCRMAELRERMTDPRVRPRAMTQALGRMQRLGHVEVTGRRSHQVYRWRSEEVADAAE